MSVFASSAVRDRGVGKFTAAVIWERMGEALQPGAWQTFAAISDLLKKWFSSLALSITHCCVAILFVASDDPHSLLHLFFFFSTFFPKSSFVCLYLPFSPCCTHLRISMWILIQGCTVVSGYPGFVIGKQQTVLEVNVVSSAPNHSVNVSVRALPLWLLQHIPNHALKNSTWEAHWPPVTTSWISGWFWAASVNTVSNTVEEDQIVI